MNTWILAMMLTTHDGLFVREFDSEAACVAEMQRYVANVGDSPVLAGIGCVADRTEKH